MTTAIDAQNLQFQCGQGNDWPSVGGFPRSGGYYLTMNPYSIQSNSLKNNCESQTYLADITREAIVYMFYPIAIQNFVDNLDKT